MWYAIQTFNGKEEKVRSYLINNIGNYETLLPKRKLEIRRQGKYYMEEKSVYPGYFFVNGIDDKIINELREAIGFVKVLWENSKPTPIPEDEMQFVFNITKDGEIIGFSYGVKDGEKVRIVSGPLMHFEGIIKKIDRRKKRATIELELLNRTMLVNVGLEIVDKI